jgi:hypothetical protein
MCVRFVQNAATGTAEGIIKAAARKFYQPKIENHVRGIGEKDPSTGRHILSVWTNAQKSSTEIRRNPSTGVLLFSIPVSAIGRARVAQL